MNVCPECGKDDQIQKLSVIYSSGQSSGTFSGPAGGVAYVDGKWGSISGYSTLTGTSMSELARLLSPPPEPKEGRGLGYWVFPLLLIPFGMLLYGCIGTYLSTMFIIRPSGSTLEGAGRLIFPLVLVISLGLIFAGVIVFRGINKFSKNKRREQDKYYAEKKPLWDRAMSKWRRLYFCFRDGIVFDHLTNEKCQPQQVREFVYKG